MSTRIAKLTGTAPLQLVYVLRIPKRPWLLKSGFHDHHKVGVDQEIAEKDNDCDFSIIAYVKETEEDHNKDCIDQYRHKIVEDGQRGVAIILVIDDEVETLKVERTPYNDV
jgi:hypothetical protein